MRRSLFEMNTKPLRTVLALVGSALILNGCSTTLFSKADESLVEDQRAIVANLESQTAGLQSTIAELRSENTRLKRNLETLRRSKAAAEQTVASFEKQAVVDAEQAALEAQNRKPVLVVPPPPKDPESIIVAEATPLSASAVPVESTPRLVEPSFAAVEAVFENEAGTAIETTSVLFGVHLASYRNTARATTEWRNLQRDNPDLLGLLEPRVKQVDIKERGRFYRLIAGGFSTKEKAEALCATLKRKKTYCVPTGFEGERLDIPAAGR